MSDSTTRLVLTLDGGLDTTAGDLEELSRRIRDDLLELDVEAVEPAKKETPEGSKAGSAIDWTTLLVTLASSGVLTAVVAAIQGWLLRNQESNVTVKIGDDELMITGAGPYSNEQELAIQKWLKRHKGYVLPNERSND